jgi:hypothetical protein
VEVATASAVFSALSRSRRKSAKRSWYRHAGPLLAGEAGNEQVPSVQLVEHIARVRTPRDGGAHLRGELVEDGGLEQEGAQIRWLGVEHLLGEEAPEVGLGGPRLAPPRPAWHSVSIRDA